MDALGRYYTTDVISTLLVNNFEMQTPKRILDLGVGDASLTLAAYAKWSTAKYFATEIEKGRAITIDKKLSFIKVVNCDTLEPNASIKLKIKFGTIDIAICNPPYIKVKDKIKYNRLFKSVGCDSFRNLKRITSEIVFFAHNLKLLKSDGELGIIVSDSLITGKDFTIFRKTILENFNVRRIIQLPDKIFNKTEARTHIIFISKAKCLNETCELLSASVEGKLSTKIELKKNVLVERMDYQFHNTKLETTNLKSLKDIGGIIKRGKFSFKELRASKLSFFHSTHFKDYSVKINFEKPVSQKHCAYAAHCGDILMCRVGKRIVGRIAVISSGSVINSDCIYKISVPKEFQKILLKSFLCQQGRDWLKAYAHGVCSQVISKSDLENFPLYLSK